MVLWGSVKPCGLQDFWELVLMRSGYLLGPTQYVLKTSADWLVVSDWQTHLFGGGMLGYYLVDWVCFTLLQWLQDLHCLMQGALDRFTGHGLPANESNSSAELFMVCQLLQYSLIQSRQRRPMVC